MGPGGRPGRCRHSRGVETQGRTKGEVRDQRLHAGREYTDTSLLPGAQLFQHTVVPDHAGAQLQVRITMSGPLSLLWAKIMGGGFRDSAQADPDRLVGLVGHP